jgi:hypothetical protein
MPSAAKFAMPAPHGELSTTSTNAQDGDALFPPTLRQLEKSAPIQEALSGVDVGYLWVKIEPSDARRRESETKFEPES